MEELEATKILVFTAGPIVIISCILAIIYEFKHGPDHGGEGQDGI